MPVSERSLRLPPFYVMEILERARALEDEGREISHLEIGEPDFPTPLPVIEAAIQALKEGKTKYTHSQGIHELREAIALHYGEKYGVEVSPDCIVVTSGTSPAMVLVFAALLNPGEELILTDPCYACYPNILEFVEGVPRYVKVKEEDGFQYHASELEKELGPRVKGILVNSPSNPCGTLIPGEELEALAQMTGPKRFLVSDEIYHGLVYEGRERSALEFTQNAFVLNGFSKLYAMTGWRLGYVISPPQFVRPLQKIQQNLLICANSFVQWAGIAALTSTTDHQKRMRETYDKRRIFLIEALGDLGFGVKVKPTGAFYIFANARRFTNDVHRFTLELLEEAGVAVAPGIDFGPGGEGYVRFSYANSLDNIEKGVDRLRAYLGGR